MSATSRRFALLWNPRIRLCVLLGFTSGLPLYVLFTLVPVWLRSSHVDLAAVGLFALVQFPYTWKFLWAPLLDRYQIPLLGRRRGIMLITQVCLVVLIAVIGRLDPVSQLAAISACSALLAFVSATLDIAIDAFRRELLHDDELGPGNGVHVTAYKLSSLVPGALALVLLDRISADKVFLITALFMLPGIAMALLVDEPGAALFRPRTLKEAVVEPFLEFLQRGGVKQGLLILLFMLLYKLGDALATSMSSAFYLDLGFTRTQIGLIAKNVGLWASVVGGIAGTAWMVVLGINRALWVFGVLQIGAILAFAWLGHRGADPFALAITIGSESFVSVGLGTAALSAYLARSSDVRYTATQYALFSSLVAVPRTLASAATGFIVEAIGWVPFFELCAVLSVPALLLLPWVAPWRRGESDDPSPPGAR
jgi:MFS transporter, PAT family, beta-lactamase induction signal transducer AmpG